MVIRSDLDREWERRGHYFCRYADDCNIYVRSVAAGHRVMASTVRFLEEKLRLRVNREKSAVAPVGERKFLGHRLLLNGKLGISTKSIQRAKEKIRQIARRNRGVSLARVIVELNLFLAGWITYYRYAACRFELQCLDEWIRRKLRGYRLKQRKRGSSVSGFFRRLGVSALQASRLAGSGKGLWRLALTRQLNTAMSVEWFLSRGSFPSSSNMTRYGDFLLLSGDCLNSLSPSANLSCGSGADAFCATPVPSMTPYAINSAAIAVVHTMVVPLRMTYSARART